MPSSRPQIDPHAALRPGGASSRPSVDPYHPSQGRPSSKPSFDPHAGGHGHGSSAAPSNPRALVQHTDPDFREALDRLALAPPLGEQEAQALAGAFFRCMVGANQVVFGQGEKADTAYVLAAGLARMEYAVAGRPVEAVGSVKPGDIIGEGAIVGGDSHPVTVAAGTECVFLAMGGGQFAELQRQAPAVAVRFLIAATQQQVRRSRADTKKIDQFSCHVLGIAAPPPPQAQEPAGAAQGSALGRLFSRFSGGGKEEP